ncbi:DUF3866 family protein [Dermabacter sp. HMSC08H10]|uniref:DUF3866 family protein n=1 Tax=Dermabacter sp. HMSC08H10 TaxID=1581144 RepID=UPI0008A15C58|nr:DUF3866 family protein [Dermabacter sp. HMSC08H10]OFT20937.1 hypothetical protein HMPREF3176_04870 [Dermabacter sp. HMSC08H10]
MIAQETGTVLEHRDAWPGVCRVWAALDSDGTRVSALAYLDMVAAPAVGDRLLLNTNALRKSLGTGGDAFIIANLDACERGELPAGHMMKARYTPQQMMVDAIDDPASPAHEAIDAVESLDGMSVIVAGLHSAVGPIAAGFHAVRPGARLVYVHTDWAALPVAYSRANARLREEGILSATISAGQSFGGDAEAVSVPSALAAARAHFEADAVIVAQGPGNLGTGTRWGFGSIAVADALHAAAAMGARAICAPRVSEADPRSRHVGLSHHSRTVLERMLFAGVELPSLSPSERSDIDLEIAEIYAHINSVRSAHGVPAHRVTATSGEGLEKAIRALPVRVSTMGRGLEEDRASFLYSALAGRLAAEAPTA